MRLVTVALVVLLFAPLVDATPITRSYAYQGTSPGPYLGQCLVKVVNDLNREITHELPVPYIMIPHETASECWHVTTSPQWVDLGVTDATGLRMAAYYVFFDAAFNGLGEGIYCDAITREAPAGLAWVEVGTMTTIDGIAQCGTYPLTTWTPTTGTLTMRTGP
jgi:hypothetical protein